jgi:hypothetical protein
MRRICPRCGVTFYNKTNPTCYNCVRIGQEEKRYGRRRPRKARTVPPSPPIKKRPKKKQPVVKKVTGQETPRKAIKPIKKKPKKKQAVKTAVVKEVVDRKMQRKAINQLLSDLYKPNSRYLSDILRDGGLTPQQIAQLRGELLAKYLDTLVAALISFWLEILRWPEYVVFRAKYAVKGKKPPQRILTRLRDFSREEIDKYQEDGLRKLRFASSIMYWETIVVRTASSTLLKAGDVGGHHHA